MASRISHFLFLWRRFCYNSICPLLWPLVARGGWLIWWFPFRLFLFLNRCLGITLLLKAFELFCLRASRQEPLGADSLLVKTTSPTLGTLSDILLLRLRCIRVLSRSSRKNSSCQIFQSLSRAFIVFLYRPSNFSFVHTSILFLTWWLHTWRYPK